jgi:hypothetical protein
MENGEWRIVADLDASNSVVSDTAINPSSIPIDVIHRKN